MTKNMMRSGFIVAGLMNIGGVLLFSRGFTNTAINQADPVVMSNFGLVMIAVWGLAYLGAAAINANIKWLAGAFAVEKLVYVVVWTMWLSDNSLVQLYAKDMFAGAFFSIYGLNDFAFMLFFAWVFLLRRSAAVWVAPGINPEAMRTVAREQFQVAIAGGLGPLTGRAFRIGHLGDMNAAMILGCLAGVEAAMTECGIPFGRGGVEQAVACLVRG